MTESTAVASSVAPVDPLALAQKIHSFDETASDPFSLLSLAPGLSPVSLATPLADLRNNYRKLASIIHPDRLKKIYEGATEAFQKLVRVFENVNDPAIRAKLAGTTASGKKAKAGGTAAEKKGKTEPKKSAAKPQKEKKATKPKAPKKKSKAKRDEEGSEDDNATSSSSASDSDSDSDAFSDEGAVGPQVTADNLGMFPREARDNTGCYRTPISCPGCNEQWQPDDARHYTMLMAYGIRVFCNTCLLQFGPATAHHFCPHCKSPANYDISMFDKKVTCPAKKCGKIYGFSSTPVSEKQLEIAREKIREEAEAQRKKDERARRAAARSGATESSSANGAGSAVNAELEDAIGQCMVTGACPICDKNIRMKAAREHVTQCIANPPKKRRTACVIVGEAKERNIGVG